MLSISRVLIDADPINLVQNGIFTVLEHVTDTWGQYADIFPVCFISMVLIACTYVSKYGKS